jgi:hypothetical protein
LANAGCISKRIIAQTIPGTNRRPYIKITKAKKAGFMPQVAEYLPTKYMALSSNPVMPKKEKRCNIDNMADTWEIRFQSKEMITKNNL